VQAHRRSHPSINLHHPTCRLNRRAADPQQGSSRSSRQQTMRCAAIRIHESSGRGGREPPDRHTDHQKQNDRHTPTRTMTEYLKQLCPLYSPSRLLLGSYSSGHILHPVLNRLPDWDRTYMYLPLPRRHKNRCPSRSQRLRRSWRRWDGARAARRFRNRCARARCGCAFMPTQVRLKGMGAATAGKHSCRRWAGQVSGGGGGGEVIVSMDHGTNAAAGQRPAPAPLLRPKPRGKKMLGE
jgi:hypothetical protein